MLVMTAVVGEKERKESQYSHASKMKYSFPPMRYAPPMSESSAPLTTVGSRPADMNISDIIDVTVLLPWVPAMPILSRQPLISQPR